MGHVYHDFNLNGRRRPRWLRRSVQELTTQYSIPIMPPEVQWQSASISEEIDIELKDKDLNECLDYIHISSKPRWAFVIGLLRVYSGLLKGLRGLEEWFSLHTKSLYSA